MQSVEFLETFAELRKVSISFVFSFVRMEQLGAQWTEFNVTWYMIIFQNSVEKI
jgi:hypothetical protein